MTGLLTPSGGESGESGEGSARVGDRARSRWGVERTLLSASGLQAVVSAHAARHGRKGVVLVYIGVEGPLGRAAGDGD